MKTGPFTPKPGDLFRWHYESDDAPCYQNDELFTTHDDHWIRLHDIHFLIALTESNIIWYSNQRVVFMRQNGTLTAEGTRGWPAPIYPRKLK